MPRNDYTKTRRMMMQAVMCLILGCTVGLAAFITHQRELSGRGNLTEKIYVGSVGARFPKGWVVESRDPRGTGLILFTATERDLHGRKGRVITIRQEHVNSPISSEEYLGTGGLLRGTDPFSDEPADNIAQPILIAGAPGVMVCARRVIMGIPLIRPSQEKTVWVAASVRPSLVVISVELERPDDTAPDSDPVLLQDIAAAIDVRDGGK